MKCASNLNLLKLSGCPKIGNSFIDAAIELAKNRSNNLVLKMHINRYRNGFYEVNERSDLLHLTLVDINDDDDDNEVVVDPFVYHDDDDDDDDC